MSGGDRQTHVNDMLNPQDYLPLGIEQVALVACSIPENATGAARNAANLLVKGDISAASFLKLVDQIYYAEMSWAACFLQAFGG